MECDLLVSIIVPIYNVQNELSRCIDSLLNQTYHYLEIILVDDGSTDNCPKICDRYAKSDNRIKVIHKDNGGLSDARNEGMVKATGKYILFVDSDDFIELDTCECFLRNIEGDPDILVGACKEYVDGMLVLEQRHSNLKEGIIYTNKEYILKSIKQKEFYAPAWLNMYSTEFLRKNNLYYKKGAFFEDLYLQPKLFLRAKKIKYIDYSFYNYIIRSNSIMTSNLNDKKILDLFNALLEWKRQILLIDDQSLQKCMYAMLIKHYLHACKYTKTIKYKKELFNFRYALLCAIDFKERLKVIAFSLFPLVYINI